MPPGNETAGLQVKEHALIRAAQKGDRQALADLAERYWDRLYRWLYQLTRNQHAAEDLVQETFLKAFAALGSFRAGTNFRAWLFRIGHNCLVNQHRQKARMREPMPDEVPGPERGDPLEQAQSREALQVLAAAVHELPAEFRTAFLLRVDEDLSFREIAEVLGLTEETARWRVFKARHKLVQALTPQREREKS